MKSFVRKSNYRHVFGTAAKPNESYADIDLIHGDRQSVAANPTYLAASVRGGGGPVLVHKLSKKGRIGRGGNKVSVHKSKVLECAFSPFNDSLLATASDDCYACVTVVPDEEKFHVTTANVKLEGHVKKVTNLAFHPTADNILATGSADSIVKLWDIEAQVEKSQFEGHSAAISSITWNSNGSQMMTSAKDLTVQIHDPRDPKGAASFEAFDGPKPSTALFANDDKIIVCGSTRSSQRKIKIFDAKNLSKPLTQVLLDSNGGQLVMHYDSDLGLLYIGGKGDSSIKYFEVQNDKCYPLSEYRDNAAQKGVVFLPKRTCDANKCEILRALRILRDTIIPISFAVPRKSGLFQKDIFPDTYAGESTNTAAGYFEGKNTEPKKVSMDPATKKDQVAVKKVFVAKKSPNELQQELDAANAKIKALEAEVARLKAK